MSWKAIGILLVYVGGPVILLLFMAVINLFY
jgi:hypothetical protein